MTKCYLPAREWGDDQWPAPTRDSCLNGLWHCGEGFQVMKNQPMHVDEITRDNGNPLTREVEGYPLIHVMLCHAKLVQYILFLLSSSSSVTSTADRKKTRILVLTTSAAASSCSMLTIPSQPDLNMFTPASARIQAYPFPILSLLGPASNGSSPGLSLTQNAFLPSVTE